MMVAGGVTGSPPPVWTQRASDNFDSGTPSADLTTSGNWTALQGTMIYTPTTGGSVAQNSVAFDNFYYYSAASFLTNQYSQATLIAGSGAIVCGVAARIQSGSVSCYFLMYDGANAKIVRYNSGTGTTVVQTAKSYVDGNKLRIEVTGAGSATRITGYEDVGSGFVAISFSGQTVIDPGATYIDNGKAGLFGYNGRTGFYLDNWSAGDQP